MSDQQELALIPEDWGRMAKQRRAVFVVMSNGAWHSLRGLEELTGYPQASISARLRDLRKQQFGGHTVARKRRFDGSGTFLYKLEA